MKNCLKDIVYGIKSGIKNEESNMWLVCLSHGAKNVDMLKISWITVLNLMAMKKYHECHGQSENKNM